MESIDYVAIDFETANGNMTSACSIGLVGARNGNIIFEKYYLINPQEYFYPQNIAIHGITPNDVKDAPTFPEIYPEIFELINDRIVFAHAASFDIEVLKSLIKKYDLKYPNIKIGCTLKVARIAFKGILPHFKLSIISDYLEVNHNHHNAISDAKVCYYMLERVKRMYQVLDVIDLFEMIGLSFGFLNSDSYKPCHTRLKRVTKEVIVSKKLEGMIIAFTGKPKQVTKTEFKKLIEKNGGLYSREINRVINTFVVFKGPTKAHLLAVENLSKVREIKVYDEKEIMEIINGK